VRLAETSGSAREVVNALSTRALALETAGNLQEAAASARRAVETARGLGLPSRDWTRLLHNAGYLLARSGKPAEGLAFLDESYAIRLRELGERHPRTLHSAINRANALRSSRRVDEGISLLERVIEVSAPRASDLGDPFAAHRQNALRQLGAAYIQRGGEGDRERALKTNEQAIDARFAESTSHVSRLRTAVSNLTRVAFESADAASAAARLRAAANRASELSGRPEAAALVRSMATRWLVGAGYAGDAWEGFTDIATCRSDRAMLVERFGATSSEAFEGEITLLLALERADDPALLAEAAVLRASLEERTAANFGASSSKARTLERTRPGAR
jgi:tetratricopeptide (TPR) repeat protein